MSFHTEQTSFIKTSLSDLQGAWQVFRQTVVDNSGFDGWERVIFQTDEAMSWETVRNLQLMPPLVLTIRNICTQGNAPNEVMQALNDVQGWLEEALEEYPN